MAKKLSEEQNAAPNLAPATFLKHYHEIRRKKLKVDEVVGEYRAARKAAKSDGVNMASLAMLEGLARMDAEEAQLRLKQLGYYARIAGCEFVQMDLFGHYDTAPVPDEVQRDAACFEAADRGRLVGLAGQSDTMNPWPAGDERHVHWLDGWKNGKVMHDRATPGVTAKRVGRKAKSGNPEDRAEP